MLIKQKLQWVILAGAALILSGCVAPPPPQGAYQYSEYNGAVSQPVVTNSLPQYYENSAPQQVYYEPEYYQPQQAYVDPYYYAPAYPIVGASIAYGLYGNDRYYDRRHKHHSKRKHKRRHDGEVRKHKRSKKHASKRTKHHEGRKHNKRNAENRAQRRAERRAVQKKKKLILENLPFDPNQESQRSSDGN